jgi:hypothetical protein
MTILLQIGFLNQIGLKGRAEIGVSSILERCPLRNRGVGSTPTPTANKGKDMKYKKLTRVKCDDDGIPSLIQSVNITNGAYGCKEVEITFFNGIMLSISHESILDWSGNKFDISREIIEKICNDFNIFEDVFEGYKWLSNYKDGKFLEETNPISISVLKRKEREEIEKNELIDKINNKIKEFYGSNYKFEIEKENFGKYTIINQENKIIALGEDYESLYESVLEYINLKSLTPVEYLTKLIGEKILEKDKYEKH